MLFRSQVCVFAQAFSGHHKTDPPRVQLRCQPEKKSISGKKSKKPLKSETNGCIVILEEKLSITLVRHNYPYPEFCKGLCKKCPENRMNSGVQGIFYTIPCKIQEAGGRKRYPEALAQKVLLLVSAGD